MTWLTGSKTTIASTTESRISRKRSRCGWDVVDVGARPDPAGQPAVVVAGSGPRAGGTSGTRRRRGAGGSGRRRSARSLRPRPSAPPGSATSSGWKADRRSGACHGPGPAPCTRPSGRWRRGRDRAASVRQAMSGIASASSRISAVVAIGRVTDIRSRIGRPGRGGRFWHGSSLRGCDRSCRTGRCRFCVLEQEGRYGRWRDAADATLQRHDKPGLGDSTRPVYTPSPRPSTSSSPRERRMHVAPVDLRALRQGGIGLRFAMLGQMAYVFAEIPPRVRRGPRSNSRARSPTGASSSKAS